VSLALDPFCGTGTTLLAAMKANRNGIGVEIDSEYCNLAYKKISKEKSDLFFETDIKFEKSMNLNQQNRNNREIQLTSGSTRCAMKSLINR